MRSLRDLVLCFTSVGLLGCGGATPEAAAPPAAAAAHEESSAAGPAQGQDEPGAPAAAKVQEAGFPPACQTQGALCLPSRAFVGRLCKDEFMGAALHLLAKSTPYSRGYVRMRQVDSVNTRGGPASDTKLVFDEEVLILEHFGNAPGGMQVSGAGGYIVLRWDGTCATLDEAELATRVPPKPRHAPFDWKYIDPKIQDALLKDARVLEARKKHRKECQGVTMGERSFACVKADEALNATVVVAVREGAEMPMPEKVP